MNEHYYTEDPHSEHKRRLLTVFLRGQFIEYYTDSSIFSSKKLDRGTELLINSIAVKGNERLLDLGCGSGIIGIALSYDLPAGYVAMSDVNRRAVKLSKENVKKRGIKNVKVVNSDLFENLSNEKFDVIVTNPPYRVGRKFIMKMLTEVGEHIKGKGQFYMVGKRSEGILYYQDRIVEFYGNVEVVSRGGGYRVLRCTINEK